MRDLYCLSYDLIKDKDYDRIISKLEEIGAKRVLLSVWCFKRSNTSAAELRDFFAGFLDSDDRLMVVKSSESAWRNTLFNPKNL